MEIPIHMELQDPFTCRPTLVACAPDDSEPDRSLIRTTTPGWVTCPECVAAHLVSLEAELERVRARAAEFRAHTERHEAGAAELESTIAAWRESMPEAT